MNRHECRVQVVFALYQHLLLKKDLTKSFIDNFSDDEHAFLEILDKENSEFVNAILDDLKINENNYIEEIGGYLNHWTFDRLSYLEQAILLNAHCEITKKLNNKNIVIDESIRIAKEFCDEDAYKYINGVLDRL